MQVPFVMGQRKAFEHVAIQGSEIQMDEDHVSLLSSRKGAIWEGHMGKKNTQHFRGVSHGTERKLFLKIKVSVEEK